jgi:hypothetical protein
MRVREKRISDLKFEISDLGTAREGEGISDLKLEISDLKLEI